MVSKYDLFYSVFLNDNLPLYQLVKKMGKDSYDYPAIHSHMKNLEEEGLVKAEKKGYCIADNEKATKFIRVIDFCVRNGIDYNELFLEKTIEFIVLGLKGKLKGKLPFHSKTIARISSFMSKHGFIIIESRKPFSARLVCSDFLKTSVELFGKTAEVKCDKIFEKIDEKELDSQIEKEFSKYKKSKKEISIDDEVSFIHRSLSLEGNTMTLPETEKLIKESIPPKSRTFQEMQETIDYKKALDALIKEKQWLDIIRILNFHETAMGTLQAGAGKIRKQEVKIKGNPDFKVAKWQDILPRLESFLTYYKENNYKRMKAHEAVEFASYLHSEFQRIHPFLDGNSRTARAIFVHTLIMKGFPLITFPAGFVQQYMELTKLSKSRDEKNFGIFMKQLVLHSLKRTNVKLRYS